MPELCQRPVGIEIIHRQVTRFAVGSRSRQVGLIVFVSRPATVIFPCNALAMHNKGSDARKLYYLHKVDAQQAVSYLHILECVIQCPVPADLSEDVQLVDDCFGL